MKMITFILLVFGVHVSAKTSSQSVSFTGKDVPLEKVFQAVKKQTGFFVFANKEIMKNKKPVSLSVRNMPLPDFMELVLRPSSLDFEISGNNIVIKEGKEVFSRNLSPGAADAGPRFPPVSVSGQVLDPAGMPVAAASITIKGSGNATSADGNGRFLLRGVPENAVFEISAVGFLPLTLRIAGNYTAVSVPLPSLAGKEETGRIINDSLGSLVVKLARSIQYLEQVVAIGYGSQKRINLTGAVSTVSAQDIQGRPITQASQALQGLVPGVFVNTNSGEAGNDESSIIIRGIGSLNQSSSPLVLIDGIEGSLNDVAASDIESLSVLKDAAAAAIYGTRGAKGVILVTTHRGKFGQTPVVRYNGYGGFSMPTIMPDMVVDNRTYMEVYRQAAINSNRNFNFTDADIERYAGQPGTDWRKVLIRESAPVHNHEVSATGGSENLSYYVSLGYLDQQGWLAGGQRFRRYNSRINLDARLTDRLKLGTSFAGIFKDAALTPKDESDIRSAGGKGSTIFSGALVEHPMVTPFTKSGFYSSLEEALGIERNRPNGQGIADNEKGQLDETNFSGNMFLEYSIFSDLKAKATLGINVDHENTLITRKEYQGHDQVTEAPIGNDNSYRNIGSYLSVDNRKVMELTNMLQLDYAKRWARHYFKALGGFSRQIRRRDASEIEETQFGSTDLVVLGNGTIRETDGVTNDRSSLISLFARLNYSFDNKYLLEANIRRDGSSRFGKNNRWGSFPGFSAGWIVSGEDFWTSNFVSYLKIRGSWGILGSEPDDRFAFLSELQLGRNYIDNSGAAITKLGNPDLKWEETRNTNLGLNMGILKNKISFEADYFERATHDILVKIDNPLTSGVSGKTTYNAASMLNKGMEASVKYSDKAGSLSFSIGANITYVKNKILTINPDLADDADRIEIDRADNVWWIRGEPINVIYGHQFGGIFQSTEEITKGPDHSFIGKPKPGDIKYVDRTGDGIIDLEDRVILGNRNPEWLYGVNLELSFKGFELTALLQGIGNAYVNLARETGPFPFAGLRTYWLDAWTTDNPSQSVPGVWVDRTGYNGQTIEQAGKYNSFWMQNRRYTRVKNIQLAYNFPKNMLGARFLKEARIFVNAQNLFTFTSMRDFDPERDALQNHASSTLPQSKTVTLGVRLTF